MSVAARAGQFASLILLAAISGFFYAYWCSVMIGLDEAGPQTGAAAMQAVNRTVRNAMFAPAFFGPLLVVPLAAILSWLAGACRAALWLAIAAAIYVTGAFAVTLLRNVQLNDALAPLPAGDVATNAFWVRYLADWGWWNALRMVASFLALLCVGLAFIQPVRREPKAGA